MNKVIITGARLTKDVTMRQTQNGMPVVQFSIAVNRPKKKGEQQAQADFFNCVAWNHTAEFIAKYFTKGSGINIEGRLAARSYDDKTGKKVYVVEIVCDNVEFNGPKVDRQQNDFGFKNYGANEPVNNSLPGNYGADEPIPF